MRLGAAAQCLSLVAIPSQSRSCSFEDDRIFFLWADVIQVTDFRFDLALATFPCNQAYPI